MANAQDVAAHCEELWTLPGGKDGASDRRDAFERDWLGGTVPRAVPASEPEDASAEDFASARDVAAVAAEALDACVARNLYAPGPSGALSPLWLLANNAPLGSEGTPALDCFLERVLGETCTGLVAEGFEADGVCVWQRSLRELVSGRWDALSFEACTPGGPARRDLLRILIAGIVYGPAHPLAK